MKIAVIANHAGMLLNFRGPLLEAMARRGHEVLGLAPDHDDASRAALVRLGVQPVDWSVGRVGMNPLKDLRSLLDLWRLLRRHQPSLTLSYAIKPVIYGLIGSRLANVPRRYAMIEGLGFAFTSTEDGSPRSLLRWVASELYRLALRFSHRTIFLNPDDQDLFASMSIVSPERSVVLGGIGVDLEEWPCTPVPTDPVSFILIARLLWDKGVGEYRDAIRIVRKRHPDARFFLVGGLDDNPRSVTQTEVESWLAEGLIDLWPGHVPVRPWLERASVFVLPSYYREGVPRSTQEAMALGRPVITTDVPGCRETVVPGRNGLLVPPRDAVALAAAMEHFILNPQEIPAMGRESRRLAEERFDVHEQNRKILSFLELD